MAEREEFKIKIRKDGRIEVDFRGMKIESYRRMVELMEEMVGPVRQIDEETEEAQPPREGLPDE